MKKKKEKREEKFANEFSLDFSKWKTFQHPVNSPFLSPVESLVVCALQLKLKMHSNSLDEREKSVEWVEILQNFISCIPDTCMHACTYPIHSGRPLIWHFHILFPPLSLSCADDKNFPPFFPSCQLLKALTILAILCVSVEENSIWKINVCERENETLFLYDDEKPSPEPRKEKQSVSEVWSCGLSERRRRESSENVGEATNDN